MAPYSALQIDGIPVPSLISRPGIFNIPGRLKCPTKREPPPIFATQSGIHCFLGVTATSSVKHSFLQASILHQSFTTSGIKQSLPILPIDLSRASDGISVFIEKLVLADLDPSSAKLAIGILGPFLSAFGFLFVLRIVMSWYPKLPVGKFPYVIAYAPTEPLLIPTRKLIPPLGGVDVTPVVWFGLVSFLSEILVGPQGLLVLLSQQV